MAVLDIVLYPDAPLLDVAKPIDAIDDSVRQLARDLADTMYAKSGVGLAAPQVGASVRMVVIDPSDPEKDEPARLHTLINPIIVEREGRMSWEEGCLSLPGLYREVETSEKVVVEALDLDGKLQRIEADGLFAVGLQHELDHLDGVVFIDRLSPLKRRFALKEWKRLRAEALAARQESA